jgi:hypothetical protein
VGAIGEAGTGISDKGDGATAGCGERAASGVDEMARFGDGGVGRTRDVVFFEAVPFLFAPPPSLGVPLSLSMVVLQT